LLVGREHGRTIPLPVISDGATVFGDLVGTVDVLVVECRNAIGPAAARRPFSLDGGSHCPRKRAAGISDQCHARCPDFLTVL